MNKYRQAPSLGVTIRDVVFTADTKQPGLSINYKVFNHTGVAVRTAGSVASVTAVLQHTPSTEHAGRLVIETYVEWLHTTDVNDHPVLYLADDELSPYEAEFKSQLSTILRTGVPDRRFVITDVYGAEQISGPDGLMLHQYGFHITNDLAVGAAGYTNEVVANELTSLLAYGKYSLASDDWYEGQKRYICLYGVTLLVDTYPCTVSGELQFRYPNLVGNTCMSVIATYCPSGNTAACAEAVSHHAPISVRHKVDLEDDYRSRQRQLGCSDLLDAFDALKALDKVNLTYDAESAGRDQATEDKHRLEDIKAVMLQETEDAKLAALLRLDNAKLSSLLAMDHAKLQALENSERTKGFNNVLGIVKSTVGAFS